MKKIDKEGKKYLKRLGEHIKNLRKERGLTQVQLAEELETKHPQIGRLERGETNITVLSLRNLAHILQVTINELMRIE